MITRFLDANHHAPWVAGDEVYGGNRKLRTALEQRGTEYALAVACNHEVSTRAGKYRADILANRLPKWAWQKLSAGAGAKGRRCYGWAHIALTDPAPGQRHLLAPASAADDLSAGCGIEVAGRGDVPVPKGLGRSGRAPGSPLHLVVPLATLAHACLSTVRAGEHIHRPASDDLLPLTCNEMARLFVVLVTERVHGTAH